MGTSFTATVGRIRLFKGTSNRGAYLKMINVPVGLNLPKGCQRSSFQSTTVFANKMDESNLFEFLSGLNRKKDERPVRSTTVDDDDGLFGSDDEEESVQDKKDTIDPGMIGRDVIDVWVKSGLGTPANPVTQNAYLASVAKIQQEYNYKPDTMVFIQTLIFKNVMINGISVTTDVLSSIIPREYTNETVHKYLNHSMIMAREQSILDKYLSFIVERGLTVKWDQYDASETTGKKVKEALQKSPEYWLRQYCPTIRKSIRRSDYPSEYKRWNENLRAIEQKRVSKRDIGYVNMTT